MKAIMMAMLMMAGLCFPTITIYTNITAPNPTLTLVSGGDLAVNTTYNFQCVYIRDYRAYYGNGCFSNTGEEVNITTNDTHKSINMLWGAYPFPMNNIICRWRNDNQSFKWGDGTYKTYGDNGNGTSGTYWQNWTDTNNYGGLTIWTGTNKNITATNLKSGGSYAPLLAIPYFSMRNDSMQWLNMTFPLTGGSACIHTTGTNTGTTLHAAALAQNATAWIKSFYNPSNGAVVQMIYGFFFGQGSISYPYASSVSIVNHALSPGVNTTAEKTTIVLERASLTLSDDQSLEGYAAPVINSSNSYINIPSAALSMASMTSTQNTLFTGMTLPTSYIRGASNWVFTRMGNHNNRYPVQASHITENNTYYQTSEYITAENTATNMNTTFNFTNLKFYNNGWATAYDIYFDVSAAGSTINGHWNNYDFYQTSSDRSADGKPVVYGGTIPAAGANFGINASFYSTTRFRLVNPNGTAATGYNISLQNNLGNWTQGAVSANGDLNLTIKEYLVYYNNSTATSKTVAMNLTPIQVNISLSGVLVNQFNHSIYGAKDWVVNMAPICTATDNIFNSIIITNTATSGLVIN